MATRLSKLQYRKVALVDRGANPDAHIQLFKRDDTMPKEPTVDELKAQLDEVTKAKDAAEAKVAELTAEPEDVEKALPEPVRKELAALRKQAAEDRARVAKVEDDRQREQAIQKAGTFKALGAADDLGSVLFEMRKSLKAETVAKVETLLAGWNAAIEKGAVFSEIGSGGRDTENDPTVKLDKMAEQYQAKHEGVSFEKAYDEVCKTAEGRKLYREIAKKGGR